MVSTFVQTALDLLKSLEEMEKLSGSYGIHWLKSYKQSVNYPIE